MNSKLMYSPAAWRLLGWLILLSLPTLAQAYDPKIGHKPLSQVALAAYQTCFPKDITFQRKILQDHIVNGDTAMDEGLLTLPPAYWEEGEAIRLFSTSVRVFNWHFYNPNLTDPQITKRLLVNQSYRYLWRQANYAFSVMDYAEDRAVFLGAIMHLVEDVSVPAHVVPVYHGPTLARYLGHFRPLIDYLQTEAGRINDKGMITDAVDYLPPNHNALLAWAKQDCGGTLSKNDDPGRIRDWLARQTLKALQQDIKDCPGVPWATFWNIEIPPSDSRYFKRYNLEAPRFGQAGMVKNEKDPEHVHTCAMGGYDGDNDEDDDKRYQTFLSARHQQAIQADLRLLHWASRNLSHAP
jgi:hypothetical protein